MPFRYRIKVEGMSELLAAFKKVGGDLEQFRQVNAQVASWVGATAAGRAPRRFGMLGASFRSSGTLTAANMRFGGAQVPYAGVIHWGTPAGYRAGQPGPHNIRPSMWATNTAAYLEPQWSVFYEDFIDKVIREAGF